jgi:hypothetical protein
MTATQDSSLADRGVLVDVAGAVLASCRREYAALPAGWISFRRSGEIVKIIRLDTHPGF